MNQDIITFLAFTSSKQSEQPGAPAEVPLTGRVFHHCWPPNVPQRGAAGLQLSTYRACIHAKPAWDQAYNVASYVSWYEVIVHEGMGAGWRRQAVT